MFKAYRNLILSFCLLVVTGLFIFIGKSKVQLRLPKIICDSMVLQRGKPIPIWGWAEAGKKVLLSFAGRQYSTQVDNSGHWQVMLPAMEANDRPQTMEIETGTEHVALNNILIGEVWLCSGQSNMQYPMKRGKKPRPAKGIDSATLELTLPAKPMIRLFRVLTVYSDDDVTTTGWHVADKGALTYFSAPGYYFARDLYRKLHVPIGVISSAWGGSRIEQWTPPSAYDGLPAFKNALLFKPLMIDGVAPGKKYNSMIGPLAPFALRGFLWYQGEANCMNNDDMIYADKMQALIDSWRLAWHDDKLPFYSVLIAPYHYSISKDGNRHGTAALPRFWEAQIESGRIPYTDMISVTDLVDNLNEIHPSYKWEVGRRLSLLALHHDYGFDTLVYSGPRFKQAMFAKGKAIITFNFADGLQSKDGLPLSFFTIAGADGKFVDANAQIKGNTVEVAAPGITQPVAVRLGWTESAMPNLVNGAGLPAFPFRTDKPTWTYVKP